MCNPVEGSSVGVPLLMAFPWPMMRGLPVGPAGADTPAGLIWEGFFYELRLQFMETGLVAFHFTAGGSSTLGI